MRPPVVVALPLALLLGVPDLLRVAFAEALLDPEDERTTEPEREAELQGDEDAAKLVLGDDVAQTEGEGESVGVAEGQRVAVALADTVLPYKKEGVGRGVSTVAVAQGDGDGERESVGTGEVQGEALGEPEIEGEPELVALAVRV